MANKFLNGIEVSSSAVVDGGSLSTGSTILDIQGSQGQLFSVTNSLVGDLFSVSDISGVPILNVNSSGLVTIDGNLNLGDSDKIQLGASQDLQIYHDGSHSYIRDQGTGNLIITGSQLTFSNVADTEYMVKMVQDGTVELYYNGSKKLETTSTGVTVTGNIGATNFSGSSSGTNTGDQDLSGYLLNTTDSFSGTLTLNHSSFGLGLILNRSHASNAASIVFKNSTGQQGILYAISSDNQPYWRDGTTTNANKIWTSGNDGASSGLDADLLDGNHASAFAPSSVVNQTDFVSKASGGTFSGNIDLNASFKWAKNQSNSYTYSAADSTGMYIERFSTAGAGSQLADMRFQARNNNSGTYNSIRIKGSDNSVVITSPNTIISGNLTVNGTTTTLNTETVEVEDNILQLNTTQGTPDTATAATSGISIYRGDSITQASLIFDDGDDTWDLTNKLTVAGDVVGASLAVPSGASTGFLKADGSVDSTLYSGYTFGSTDLTFSGTDPGDIVWRNGDGDEVHRIWSGSNDYLTYRNDAGTAYELISAGSTSYNNTDWDTAYTHSQATHAPTDAEANVQSDWNATSGDALILNKPTTFPPSTHNHDDRYYTETETSDHTAQFLGWVDAYGTGLGVSWNVDEGAVEIQNSSDTSTGASYKAQRVTTGQTIRVTLMAKASTAAGAGLYLRLYQHNGDLPDGKTHVSNNASASAVVVQEDDASVTNWVENAAITTDWVTYEKEYTVLADGYISIVVLNWTGIGTNSLYITTPDIQTVRASNSDKLDAQEGTYYLNYNNFSNTPTIPTDFVSAASGGAFSGAISTPTGSTFAGAIKITEAGTAQHILIGNQDSSGADKPAMIRGVNGQLKLGYGDAWTGEGGTMTVGLTLDTSSNATFAGNIVMAANATVDGVDISALPTTFAPTNAEQNVNADWTSTSGDSQILNNPGTSYLTGVTDRHIFPGLGASATQARRHHIGRVYYCPRHWDTTWQNLYFTINEETYNSGYIKYHLFGYYNGTDNQTLNLRVVDYRGLNGDLQRYKIVLGDHTDAGWDHSSQNVYYTDVYVEVSHYKSVKVVIDALGHGITHSNPTSGAGITVIYETPTITNITYTNETYDTTYIGSDTKIWNSANDGAGSGLDADTVDGTQASLFKRINGEYWLDVNDDYESRTGTWSTGTGSAWGEPNISGGYAHNDGTGSITFTVPTGAQSCWISHLTWSSGGYIDAFGVQSDGGEVFLRRINTHQTVQNSDEGAGQHDGSTITFAGTSLSSFGKIKFQNREGRFHFTGIAFSSSQWEGTEGTGMIHPKQITQQGTGGGLDSDKLDGQQGTYYLNYANFTGTPTIPTDFVSAANGGAFSGKLVIKEGQVWDATTQGTTTGSLHIDPESGTDHAGGAITFGASDHNNGQSADAGIYIRSDGNYGTRMYFSTTDSYATGSKTAMYIDNNKDVYFLDDIDVAGQIRIASGLISKQQNTDVDGAEVVGQVASATYTAAFFDYVIKKGANVRAGIVYACHDGSNNVEFSETSTTDLGDTSDVALSVDISSGNMRLIADSATNDWSVKTLIRAI